MRRTATLVVTSLALGLAGAGPAVAAPGDPVTDAQLGAKCRAAFTGAIPSPAFTAFRSKCVTAARSAVNNATDAGNPTVATANRARANAACRVQYPPPRPTAAGRARFASCVTAAISAQGQFAGRPLTATLNGTNESPATSATQTIAASVRLNQGRRRICYTLTPSGPFTSPVSAAHIHEGGAGVNGGVVVPLSVLGGLTAGNRVTSCENGVDVTLIKRIRQRPGDFYVNVHTNEFPGGAVRGQLSK